MAAGFTSIRVTKAVEREKAGQLLRNGTETTKTKMMHLTRLERRGCLFPSPREGIKSQSHWPSGSP